MEFLWNLKGFWSDLSSRIRWPQNSCEILQGFRSELIRILVGNFSGQYIRWIKNSSRISIRILVVNAAAADCGIPMEFWLEFQLILNGAKSADCVWLKNWKISTRILVQLYVIRWLWNCSRMHWYVQPDFYTCISIRIPLVNRFWRIMMSFFCLYEKLINFRGEYVIKILQKIRWQRNSSRILIRILVENFSGK